MPLFKPMLTHSNLNKFQWSSHKILTSFFHSRKAFENSICKATTILLQHKFVRLWKSQMLCQHPILMITKINIDMPHPSMEMLTHLPLDKIASVWQTIFSNAFSWMKNFVFLVLISLKFVPNCPIDNKSALEYVVAWRRIGYKPLCETMLTRFSDA